ncbi:MAG: hypothetical protein HOP30_20725 [Cyclobacteriaceae bacterium]|nr:hypothetical protein [Cyclobacteriaceae bacterium]
MDKTISWTEKVYTGHWLMDLGYRDYIAARVLLNNNQVIQGLTLASTSVEKYLKAIIVFSLKERENYYYHFDRFEKLKNILSRVNGDITKDWDPLFIEILENAFRIRYYDKIEEQIFMGFFMNQFIGELDSTIDCLEKFILNAENDGTPFSAYNRAIKIKDPHLFENNYVLRKEGKKEFMEKPDFGFSIHIRMGDVIQNEKVVKGENIINKYEGRMSKFTEFY